MFVRRLLTVVVVSSLSMGALLAQETDSECSRQARFIIDTHAGLPKDMSSLGRTQLDKVHQQVDEILAKGSEFLKNCTDHPERSDVIYAVARLMTLNFQRELMKAQQMKLNVLEHRDRYIDTILTLIRDGLQRETDNDKRILLQKVQGHALYIGARSQEAVGVWKKLLAASPDDPDRDQIWVSLISSMLKASTNSARVGGPTNYPEVVANCDAFLASINSSRFTPTVLNVKWKALKENGELGRALEYLTSISEQVRHAAFGNVETSLTLDDKESMVNDYFRVFEQFDFNVGFCDYALGRPEAAAKKWRAYVKELAELQTQSKLSQAGIVFKNRTDRLIRVLDNLQGKEAPELSVEGWVTKNQTSIAQDRGNVIALFFTPYDQKRSEAFARALQNFYRDHWHEGFRAAMISFKKGSSEGQGKALTAWTRERLKLTYPIAMDNNRASHNSFDAAVGSGTIVVIDRDGRVAWYKMDPTERDVKLAASVYQRLLKDK